MLKHHENERVVNAYTAGSVTEAMVIRGLLENAGIHSPAPIVFRLGSLPKPRTAWKFTS